MATQKTAEKKTEKKTKQIAFSKKLQQFAKGLTLEEQFLMKSLLNNSASVFAGVVSEQKFFSNETVIAFTEKVSNLLD